MDAATVGRHVRWARKRAGLTQQDVAQAVGMPQSNIARIERGSVIPRTATLIAILEATGQRLALEPIGPAVDRGAIRERMPYEPPRRVVQALGKAALDRTTSPTRILRRLRRFNVPFVLLGDMAEVAHGVPMKLGRTVEICHAQTDVAQERLAMALDELGGTETEIGRLLLLTESAAGDDYDTLFGNAVPMLVDAALLVRVAAIEDLERARLARGSEDDRAAAAVLRVVADETQRFMNPDRPHTSKPTS